MEFKEVKKKVLKKQKLIQKHQSEITVLIEDCTHDEYLEKQFTYDNYFRYSGIAGKTDKWKECKVCGICFGETRE